MAAVISAIWPSPSSFRKTLSPGMMLSATASALIPADRDRTGVGISAEPGKPVVQTGRYAGTIRRVQGDIAEGCVVVRHDTCHDAVFSQKIEIDPLDGSDHAAFHHDDGMAFGLDDLKLLLNLPL